MAAKLWKNEEAAIMAMDRNLCNIDIILGQFPHDMGSVAITDAIGIALYREVKTICEAALFLVCCSKADPNGTLDFPRLKDLKNKGDCVDATIEARYAAGGICEMKRPFEEGPITPGMIRILFEMAYMFIQWAWEELRWFEGRVSDYFRGFARLRESLMQRLSIGPDSHILMETLRVRYIGEKDLDSMTEEEIDELYRPKRANSRKSMASLFIYLILKEHTNEGNPYRISDIQSRLETDYEISIERKAVSRYLQCLADEEKANIWVSSKHGYWYSEDEPTWME